MAIAAGIGLALGLFWMWPDDTAPPTVGAPTDAVARPDPRQSEVSQPQRTGAEVPETKDQPGAKPPRSFDEIYRDLVSLFRKEAYRGAETTDAEKARYAAAASNLFAEMVAAVPDAGERALRVLSGLPVPWAGDSTGVDIAVCSLLLDFNLQQMTATVELRQRRPVLVHALLGHMPISADFAKVAHRLLRGKPYLEAAHEPPLLDLARSATGDMAFLVIPVKDLLVTLWGNLGKAGDADYGELLAFFEDGANDVLNTAATERLLMSDKYQHLAVSRLLQKKDDQAMIGAAAFAARNLPFAVAIEVVSALKSGAENAHFGGAYACMAETSPSDLCNHYQQCLAEGTKPRHREQVVLALGNYAASKGGLELVRTALDMDPDPRVKGVALLALGNEAPVTEFQERFDRLLDDRAAASVPRSYFAMALVNRAARCDINWLDLATARLLASDGVSAEHRARLEGLRRQYLPK